MTITVNGRDYPVHEAQGEMRLIQFIREDLDLTGVKNACDIGACGACTLLVDEQPMRICTTRVKDVAGHRVLTIEGLRGDGGGLHPLQQAFIDAGAIQCGFCTPGMVLTAHAFLLHHARPSRAEIRRAIYTNLCRCTGYQQIVDAIEAAAVCYEQIPNGIRETLNPRP